MLTLAALMLASIWSGEPSEKSTVKLSAPIPEIGLPAGSEKIQANYVSIPCTDYKSEVIKEGYIMSTSQVAHLFGALSQEHAFNFQPDDSAHYLVVRVKNTGSLPARGVIKCQISPEYLPFKVQIPNLNPHMETFAHYVIPLQPFSPSAEAAKNDERFVHLDWDSLSIILDLE